MDLIAISPRECDTRLPLTAHAAERDERDRERAADQPVQEADILRGARPHDPLILLGDERPVRAELPPHHVQLGRGWAREQREVNQKQRNRRRADDGPGHEAEVDRAGKEEVGVAAHDAHHELHEEAAPVLAHLLVGEYPIPKQGDERDRQKQQARDGHNKHQPREFLQEGRLLHLVSELKEHKRGGLRHHARTVDNLAGWNVTSQGEVTHGAARDAHTQQRCETAHTRVAAA